MKLFFKESKVPTYELLQRKHKLIIKVNEIKYKIKLSNDNADKMWIIKLYKIGNTKSTLCWLNYPKAFLNLLNYINYKI